MQTQIGVKRLYNVIAFDICSILIGIIVIVVNIHKKHLDMLQHRMFLLNGLAVVLSSAVRIISCIAAMNSDIYGDNHISAAVFAAFAIAAFFPFVYVLYGMSVSDVSITDCPAKTRLFVTVPVTLIFLICMLSAGSTSMISFDGKVNVPFTWQNSTITVIGLYYAVYAVAFAYSVKNAVEYRTLRSLICAGILVAVGMLCRMLFFAYVSPNLFYAMALLVVQLTAQRTEEYIDTVTEVPNAKAFRRCFEINKKNRKFNEVYVLYVENIRLLNLTIGFSKVNSMLKKIADYLEALTDQNVFYCELGTFMLMPKLSPTEKEAFFKELKTRFSALWETGGSEILVSVRLMEIKLPTDADNTDKVYAYADYLRNSNNITSEVVQASMVALRDNSRILTVESCIKRALENDGFTMYYQPIYSTAEKKMVSAEALIRLIDPQYGYISPAEFIPISEENGSIVQIGKTVLKKVFEFISDNDIEEMGLDYIEVNLSVIQCMQKNLADNIMELADSKSVDSKKVNLEITETAAAERPFMLMQNMKMLVDNSYTFSLDDFGTGYSNISSMVDMPLDIIKFDKSIIDRAKMSKDGKILLESLAAMVKKMGKRIVAEGVETEEQLRELERIGIDFIQGFYFSRPLPADEFIEYVNEFNKAS